MGGGEGGWVGVCVCVGVGGGGALISSALIWKAGGAECLYAEP